MENEALDVKVFELVFEELQKSYEEVKALSDSKYFAGCVKGEVGLNSYCFVQVEKNFIRKLPKIFKAFLWHVERIVNQHSLPPLQATFNLTEFIYSLLLKISAFYNKPFSDSYILLSYYVGCMRKPKKKVKPPEFCPICKLYLCSSHHKKQAKEVHYVIMPSDFNLTLFKDNWKGRYFENLYRGPCSQRWARSLNSKFLNSPKSFPDLPKSFTPLLSKLPMNNTSVNCRCQVCSGSCPCVKGTVYTKDNKVFECRGYCEVYCKCSFDCQYKFLGCDCAGPCKETCICFTNSIECNPWLCRRCGSLQELTYGGASCTNVVIQKKQYTKRVKLGVSTIPNAGIGVFSQEFIRSGEFIGEYTGEVLSEKEANRRGALYDKNEHSFLFMVDGIVTIDATFFGSLLRYVNHKREKDANCFTRTWRVVGNTRVMVLARKDIQEGEEIFFDYLYTSAVPYRWYAEYNSSN